MSENDIRRLIASLASSDTKPRPMEFVVTRLVRATATMEHGFHYRRSEA